MVHVLSLKYFTFNLCINKSASLGPSTVSNTFVSPSIPIKHVSTPSASSSSVILYVTRILPLHVPSLEAYFSTRTYFADAHPNMVNMNTIVSNMHFVSFNNAIVFAKKKKEYLMFCYIGFSPDGYVYVSTVFEYDSKVLI